MRLGAAHTHHDMWKFWVVMLAYQMQRSSWPSSNQNHAFRTPSSRLIDRLLLRAAAAIAARISSVSGV
jgi:hypothetical protein